VVACILFLWFLVDTYGYPGIMSYEFSGYEYGAMGIMIFSIGLPLAGIALMCVLLE
jgi:hypothetical protein